MIIPHTSLERMYLLGHHIERVSLAIELKRSNSSIQYFKVTAQISLENICLYSSILGGYSITANYITSSGLLSAIHSHIPHRMAMTEHIQGLLIADCCPAPVLNKCFLILRLSQPSQNFHSLIPALQFILIRFLPPRKFIIEATVLQTANCLPALQFKQKERKKY